MSAVTWTLAEAAAWLDPPVTEEQLRELVRALRIEPAAPSGAPGQRGRGRPPSRYGAVEIMFLHAAVAPWLWRNAQRDDRRNDAGLSAAAAAVTGAR